MFRVRNQTRNTLLAEEVERATNAFKKMKGLLGRASLPTGHGLWIDPCNSIHTFFMRFPIDAVFVSKDQLVVRTYENIRPFRITPLVLGARSVLELPAGALREHSLEVGDQLFFEERD